MQINVESENGVGVEECDWGIRRVNIISCELDYAQEWPTTAM